MLNSAVATTAYKQIGLSMFESISVAASCHGPAHTTYLLQANSHQTVHSTGRSCVTSHLPNDASYWPQLSHRILRRPEICCGAGKLLWLLGCTVFLITYSASGKHWPCSRKEVQVRKHLLESVCSVRDWDCLNHTHSMILDLLFACQWRRTRTFLERTKLWL